MNTNTNHQKIKQKIKQKKIKQKKIKQKKIKSQ
jgi:hypothetical protein